ncbi:MAG: hypothetical protein RLZZ402_1713, partial [Bacteroidota bacterium]
FGASKNQAIAHLNGLFDLWKKERPNRVNLG